MVVVPAVKLWTIPVAASTVATVRSVLLHRPPEVASDKEVVEPVHNVVGPEMAAGVAGTVLTVKDVVVEVEPQALVTV